MHLLLPIVRPQVVFRPKYTYSIVMKWLSDWPNKGAHVWPHHGIVLALSLILEVLVEHQQT